jgi:hypothetical protein
LLPRRTPASAYLVVALLGPSEATRRECHKSDIQVSENLRKIAKKK